MLGNWRWNLGFGVFGLTLIFLLSLTNNPIITSLLRGAYAFITFFLIAYPVRFVFGAIFNPKQTDEEAVTFSVPTNDAEAGTKVNLVTPDEDEDLNEVLRAQISQKNESATRENQAAAETQVEQFQPLKPTQLVSTDKMQPEDLTKVIRHLTGE